MTLDSSDFDFQVTKTSRIPTTMNHLTDTRMEVFRIYENRDHTYSQLHGSQAFMSPCPLAA